MTHPDQDGGQGPGPSVAVAVPRPADAGQPAPLPLPASEPAVAYQPGIAAPTPAGTGDPGAPPAERDATSAAPPGLAEPTATALAGAAALGLAATAASGLPSGAAGTLVSRTGDDPPSPGTAAGTGSAAVTGRRAAQLRIGWHTASRTALACLSPPSPGSGLILGWDQSRRPVPVRMWRAEPTRIALVGGVWAAQVVLFRALALGCSALVLTVEPEAWRHFGARATGEAERVMVLTGEQRVSVFASAARPAMVICDLGVAGPQVPLELGPWQTELTVLRRLTDAGTSALARCHLLMMQRPDPAAAALVASCRGLSEQRARRWQAANEAMLVLIGDGRDRYVAIEPSEIEHAHFGPPRR